MNHGSAFSMGRPGGARALHLSDTLHILRPSLMSRLPTAVTALGFSRTGLGFLKQGVIDQLDSLYGGILAQRCDYRRWQFSTWIGMPRQSWRLGLSSGSVAFMRRPDSTTRLAVR